MAETLLLEVTVRDTHKTVYNGKAKSVTSWNEVGTFDVLPKHARFVAVIRDQLTVRDQQHREHDIPLTRGIIHVVDNQVEIFLGIESLQEASQQPQRAVQRELVEKKIKPVKVSSG